MPAEKIISIKYLGELPTYDIEVDAENHIFYGNGIATSNSHSYAYAIDAFHSAICKKKDRKKFYEVYLNYAKFEQASQEEIRELVNDAKLYDIEVTPPRLNNFHEHFTNISKDGKDTVSFGISHIKDVGVNDAKFIFESGVNFSSLSWMDILALFGSKGVNKKAFRALTSSGAFSGPANKVSRTQMLYEYDMWKILTGRETKYIIDNMVKTESLAYHVNMLINNFKIAANRLQKVLGVLNMLKTPTYSLEDDPSWISTIEKHYFGISITCGQTDYLETGCMESNCKDVRLGEARGYVNLAVEVNTIREHKIKEGRKSAGETMAFLTIEDSSAEMNSVVIFPEEYKKYKHVLFVGNTVLIQGKAEQKESEVSLIVEKVYQI